MVTPSPYQSNSSSTCEPRGARGTPPICLRCFISLASPQMRGYTFPPVARYRCLIGLSVERGEGAHDICLDQRFIEG